MRISANESYQKSEEELAILMGINIGHTTLHRLVQRTEFSPPDAKQTVTELSADGGKVRVRTARGQSCEWLEYKAIRLQEIYYNAALGDNLFLSDWVNSQNLAHLLVCLGDGHPGVWKLINEISSYSKRWEILDWYHLRENLYKVGGSLKRLKQAESYLWQGKVNKAIALLSECRRKQAQNFIKYLQSHKERIINYQEVQSEEICSIGSGAVESAIKQLDLRLKVVGAQWNKHNVNQMLQLRSAYLNGQLA